MSNPSFVASATGVLTTAGTSLVGNKPSGTADGDLLLAHLSIASSAVTVTPPTGWTLLREFTNSVGAPQGQVYAKIAASEGSTWTWTLSASREATVITHAYSPSTGTWSAWEEAVLAINVASNSASTSAAFNALACPALDGVQVGFVGWGRGESSVTQPSGWTAAGYVDSGGSTAAATAAGGGYLVLSAAAPGGGSWSAPNSGASVVWNIVIVDPGATRPPVIADVHWITTRGGSSLAVPIPPIAQTGQTVRLVVGWTNGGTFTGPSGWTLDGAQQNASATHGISYTRELDGTEGSTASVSWSSAPTAAVGAIICYAGSDIDSTNQSADSTLDASANYPGLTVGAATAPDRLVVTLVLTSWGNASITGITSGWTVYYAGIFASTNQTDQQLTVAYQFTTSANPAGGVISWNKTLYNTAFTDGVVMAAAGGLQGYAQILIF